MPGQSELTTVGIRCKKKGPNFKKNPVTKRKGGENKNRTAALNVQKNVLVIPQQGLKNHLSNLNLMKLVLMDVGS